MMKLFRRLLFIGLTLGLLYYFGQNGRLENLLSFEPIREVLAEAGLYLEPQTEPDAHPNELRLLTWNLKNFGASKNDEELAFIAGIIRDYELVAIQEVSTGPAGAQAVAKLADELDRRGSNWDYTISDPTTGKGKERYAFLWKRARVKRIGRAWLESSLADPVDREPFLARFEKRGRRILLATFHAVPTAKSPHREVILLARIHDRYPNDHVLIAGDFNLKDDHTAFNALRQRGYLPILQNQKTTLRKRRHQGEHLSKAYDNIFYENNAVGAKAGGIIDFTTQFRSLRKAGQISDHVPVYMMLTWQ